MAPFALGIPMIPVVVGHIMHIFGTGVPGNQIAWSIHFYFPLLTFFALKIQMTFF
jgi:hypothetical protein